MSKNAFLSGIYESVGDKSRSAWLATGPILSQLNAADKRRAYRMKVQQYSNEKNSIWEDVKHGLIYGSQDFVDQIKSRYLSDSQQAELPQHNRMLADIQPEVIEVEVETARVNNVLITMQKTRNGERKFALRYVVQPKDKQGALAIQRLLTEERFREIAAAFQQAVEYLDRS